jgi:oxygen-independent coproporphyrinogen-3 oxidase
MFGMPGQTLASWEESLSRALDLGPTHLACYGLIYEPGTALTKRLRAGAVTPRDEGIEAELYLAAIDRLKEAGFEHYETSNFARPGRRCRHNLTYWNNEPYVGIGPSAAGYIDGRRYKNVASHTEYVRRIEAGDDAVVEAETLTGADLATEMVMLQLRLIDGLSLAAFTARTGTDLLVAAASAIDRLRSMALINVTADRMRLTRKGLLVADSVISELAWELDGQRVLSLPVMPVGSRTPGH